jgi:hypothetical protein
MSEPDNIILEHLRAIRAKLDDVERKVGDVERKVDGKADAAHVAALERKVDGLTHVMISSFGAIINRLDSLDASVSRLEHEHA